ncbi:oxaloacetate decarboxylase [Salmonella enterica subsp. enterica]|uniref:Oxaloacetate decarboxylase n=1 Tax=Salmonella enterica I TaxID=59201 RepID=A0A447MYC3_SALET|nr:oxaloacetate decarboxylase [Salmonella enterica subsp. enterica]
MAEGDVLLILEAMKMETEIRAAQAGTVRGIAVKSGRRGLRRRHPDDAGVTEN